MSEISETAAGAQASMLEEAALNDYSSGPVVAADWSIMEQLPASLSYSPPLYIQQARQAGILAGLQRLFADVYGERSGQPPSFSDLLRQLNLDSVAVSALARTEGHPVANKLLYRLSTRLALTKEGHKQFQVLKLLYGMNGDEPRSPQEIAALTGLQIKDVRHLFIMMRCRLESEQIKNFIEETLRLLVQEFAQSKLCFEIITSENFAVEKNFHQDLDKLAAIKQLEDIADALVAQVEQTPTVNVSGKAGTGKSSLALKTAQRLLQKGKRVLYVTHSRFFASQIQSLTRFFPGDLTVSTFHALCHQYARQAGIKIPTYRNNKVFNDLFPELLIAAIHSRRENAFDAIIVDEGHAFLPNFWRALKFCLKDLHKGAFFYFYDPVILNMAKNKAAPYALRTIALTREMRPNFNLVAMRGAVSAFEVISKDEATHTLSKVIEDLTRRDYRPDQMAILSPEGTHKLCENRCKLPRGVKLAASPSSRPKHILYTSLSSFRSMNAPAVILMLDKEIEVLADWKLRFLNYMAFSRASERLILIGSKNSIIKVVPEGVKIIDPEAYEPQLRRP